jgi:hypothetical protein
VLKNEAAALAAMRGASGRNQRLNSTAFMLGGWAAYGVIDRETAYAALKSACDANGLNAEDGERQFDATFESGWGDGLEVPRELPQFMQEET